MKYLYLLFLSALLFAACSSSKESQLTMLRQEPCANEKELVNDKFYGETVDRLNATVDGKNVDIEMMVTSQCSPKLNLAMTKTDKEIRLRVIDENTAKRTCTCQSRLSAKVTDLKSGNYNILILDEGGNKLLSQSSVTINK